MHKTVIVIALVLLMLLGATPALANGIPPAFPHAFYGSVKIDGADAPDGTLVSAEVSSGTVITNVQNPVATEGGSYGIESLRLLVQGDIPNGATITFYVTDENGTATGGTATFEAGGGPTEKNLSVTIAGPTPTPSGGGGAPTYYTETDLFGTEARFRIDRNGKILATIEATSEDGNLTITIPKDTIALGKDGNRLDSLETAVDESPPDPPEDAHIIGLAYDFGPDGATFDPAITLEWSYDPDALPERVAEEDLVVAYYDEDAGEWVELDCVVDTENDTITASVEHFTTFAIIGTVTPPEEEEVAPPEEEEVAPPEEEEVAPPEEEEVAPPEEEEVPEVAPVNWLLLGAIIAVVVALGLLIYFLVVRRRAA